MISIATCYKIVDSQHHSCYVKELGVWCGKFWKGQSWTFYLWLCNPELNNQLMCFDNLQKILWPIIVCLQGNNFLLVVVLPVPKSSFLRHIWDTLKNNCFSHIFVCMIAKTQTCLLETLKEKG